MNPPLCKREDADHWEYVGEGNLNLVVRYIGDTQIYKGKVLRVIKNHKNKQCSDQDSFDFKKQFSEKVIRPLLGKEYIVELSPVNTSPAFLERLATNVEPFRPAFRTIRQIALNSPISFLLVDLTQVWPNSPTLTFELKPKWGFKPSSPFISGNTIKGVCCRFCMHSYLRAIPANNFCPLDLYSADPIRVQKALHVLLKENPLKKTLSVSFLGEKLSLGSRIDQRLLSSFGDDVILQDILASIIIKDPVLQTIKQLQMHLDEMDVEWIFSLCQHNSDYMKLITDDISIWEDVVNRYKKRRHKDTASTIECHNVEEHKQRIYEYVLSMTFKDCSLMINVTPSIKRNISDKEITLANGKSFQYDVKVIDTDLKSIEKIPFWYELDQSIVKYATGTNFQKRCY